jgi:CAAX protease family protein
VNAEAVDREIDIPALSPSAGLRRRLPAVLRHRPVVGGLGALAAFIALAYALSWSWEFPFAAAGDVIEKGKGWPTHWPALFGPALAAIAITAWLSGRPGVSDLLARMCRWRMPLRWWAATLSPVWFLGVALVVAAVSGKLPSADDFGRYSGLPTVSLLVITLLAILGALGEETGWRGFALPLLQRRYGALAAALLVTPIWALWHLPVFFTVTTYRDFAPPAYLGFVFGLACGSIVLTWLYNGTGGSILACAVWHGLFNVATATVAASGTIAAVTSSFVIIQAIVLVRLERRARKRGQASVLAPRASEHASLPVGLAT